MGSRYLAFLAGALVVLATLTGCPDNEIPQDDDTTSDDDTTAPEDLDGDGWTVADGDCDDWDPSVHPGATRVELVLELLEKYLPLAGRQLLRRLVHIVKYEYLELDLQVGYLVEEIVAPGRIQLRFLHQLDNFGPFLVQLAPYRLGLLFRLFPFLFELFLLFQRKLQFLGQAVGRGELIGYSGETGYSTTPHLHLHVERRHPETNTWRSIPFAFVEVPGSGVPRFLGRYRSRNSPAGR